MSYCDRLRSTWLPYIFGCSPGKTFEHTAMKYSKLKSYYVTIIIIIIIIIKKEVVKVTLNI